MSDDWLLEHPWIRALAERLRCPRCGAVRGEGLMLVHVAMERPDLARLTIRCLRCGAVAMGRAPLPAPLEALAAPPVTTGPEQDPVTADEMLDLHEALAGDGWWSELIGQKGEGS